MQLVIGNFVLRLQDRIIIPCTIPCILDWSDAVIFLVEATCFPLCRQNIYTDLPILICSGSITPYTLRPLSWFMCTHAGNNRHMQLFFSSLLWRCIALNRIYRVDLSSFFLFIKLKYFRYYVYHSAYRLGFFNALVLIPTCLYKCIVAFMSRWNPLVITTSYRVFAS